MCHRMVTSDIRAAAVFVIVTSLFTVIAQLPDFSSLRLLQ